MPNLPYYKKVGDANGKMVLKWKPRKLSCPFCYNEFITRDPTKMFCSTKCRHSHHNKRRRAVRAEINQSYKNK